MTTSTSCGWCHTMNPVADRFCKKCGHEAHVSRLLCRCPRCARREPTDQGDGASITAAAKAVETVLTDLRARQRENPGAAFPRELALGNVMRLKRPYWGQERREGRDKPFVFGLIVQQLHRTGGIWVVSLHLYDDEGVLYLHKPSQVLVYVDLPANELLPVDDEEYRRWIEDSGCWWLTMGGGDPEPGSARGKHQAGRAVAARRHHARQETDRRASAHMV